MGGVKLTSEEVMEMMEKYILLYKFLLEPFIQYFEAKERFQVHWKGGIFFNKLAEFSAA